MALVTLVHIQLRVRVSFSNNKRHTQIHKPHKNTVIILPP